MWENDTVVLVTSLKKHILDGKSRVRFHRISGDKGVPAFIKSLFKSRVETYLTKESPLTIKSTPHFELRPEDLENLKNRFLDVFREAAVFGADEVDSLLKEALVLRLNYMIKPADTMRRLLFNKNTSIDLQDMEDALRPFEGVLPYAEKIIKTSVAKKDIAVSQDDYCRMMNDVLSQVTGKDPIKAVLSDLTVLTEFLSETKGEEVSRLEGSIMQAFLADRNLWGFRRALDVEMKLGKEDFDVTDVEVTLKRYNELKQEFGSPDTSDSSAELVMVEEEAPEEDLIDIEPDKKPKPEPEKEPEVVETKASSPPKDDLDLGEILMPEPKAEEPAVEESVEKVEKKEEPIPEEKPVEVNDKQDKPSKKSMRIIRRPQKKEEEKPQEEVEAKEEKPEAPAKKRGLKNLIDDKTEKVFTKKLFGGDEEEYEQLINKLDEAESWRVAKILIDNELFKRDVDPFSREAIKLVDLVYGLYYPEEGVGGK